MTGAGHGYVEPPPASGLVQRAEVHGHASVPVAPEAHGEEDDVTFVTLDILQALDEDWLILAGQQFRDLAVSLAEALQLALNEPALVDVEGNDSYAHAAGRGVCKDLLDSLYDCSGLRLVLTGLAAVVKALDPVQGDAGGHVVVGREGEKPPVVVAHVAERDQALMSTAVVPSEVAGRERYGQGVVEDALQVLLVGVLLVEGVHFEEACRRKLFGVSHNHEALTPGYGADGFAGRHLGRLVEDDEVEHTGLGLEVLGHADGAHEHARAYLGEDIRYLREEGSQGHAPGGVANGSLEDV